ncbi:MAG TPA: hypothetical protein VIU11_10720 [Nakamurella sp.]
MRPDPVSGIKSDDPDVTRILAAMSAPKPPAGPASGPVVVEADEPPPLLVRGYQPPPAAAMPDPRTTGATDVVTCPECGQLATVNMARRSADDFCRNCDFPLFWAKGTVIMPEGQDTGPSLRRLPGTVGRAATASLICPHCAEPNSPTAEICVRCALSLRPVEIAEPAPPPEPIIVFEPDPEPEPEPAPGFDWWWVVAGVMALVAVALIILLIVLQ